MSFCSWCLWHANLAAHRWGALEQSLQRQRIVREHAAAIARLFADVEARIL